VPIKNADQQSVLSLHRARQGFVSARTAQATQIRGLLAEYGITLPQGISHVAKQLPQIVEDAENDLPGVFRELLKCLSTHLRELDRQVKKLEEQIQDWHRASEESQKLARIPGIGPLTESALIASIGDARNFRNGCELAAWLGLVPRQHSSGGKVLLQGISKRGDAYLRTLLVHGARSVIRVAERKMMPTEHWSTEMLGRRHKNVAAVARANKNARVAWALLAHGRDYNAGYELTS
jgi:transposase